MFSFTIELTPEELAILEVVAKDRNTIDGGNTTGLQIAHEAARNVVGNIVNHYRQVIKERENVEHPL